MTDTVPPEVRSRIMASIRSKGTGPELELRRALRALGLRGYRCNAVLRPVYTRRTADVVFPRWRVAVFVQGCFFHGCATHYREPGTNAEFWRAKVAANRDRDVTVRWRLEREGWVVLAFWEHEVNASANYCAQFVRTAVDSRRAAWGV